ncbi:proto-oncogene tyrosine-protein kinase ROS-like isoform X2 [Camponotus floridanus]|uniref:proto-oncogene tyrosine-protein kinase ROS-like isoform X2 n=1 Tax=Camponotus floridanus TaxID=104421 RepID=UPI000DC69725|nr:proto-oncogene tyrosine-protein kinase ROS-like isoform X2 [Camponotus floridanus]
MQIMFGTILCVLLKGLILTKATITSKDDTTSNIFQEESISMHPDLNFTQNISMSEKNYHRILNFKSDRSHSDSTVRNEREVDEVTLANISIIPESIENNLDKPTSLRAFVQFDSQFTEKVNDIFVTLRWNQLNFTNEIIQGYTVQCFFIEDLKEIQICEDKNITTTELEHTVHNLTFNTTYYFRVRAHTKIVAGPYTDLINVSTTHENPIPKLLVTTSLGIQIWDMDLNITNFIVSFIYEIRFTHSERSIINAPGGHKYKNYFILKMISQRGGLVTSKINENKITKTASFVNYLYDKSVINAAYSIQEHRIYWSIFERELITLINENNITKIATFDYDLHALCIDWVARNLYWSYSESDYYYIVKLDLTLWENGMIKLDEIFKSEIDNGYLSISPFMGILYHISYNRKNREYDMMKYHLDGKNEQIVQINASFCLFHYIDFFRDMVIDNMINEEPLIYWLSENYTTVTDINVSMCNTILYKKNVGDNINFKSMTIDKTNIYILAIDSLQYILYVLKKKYASLKSVKANKYVEKILISSHKNDFYSIYAFNKYLQPYPPMRCLTPDEKVKKIYNFENVTATANSIIVNLPEPVVKSGCKKYNLPTTIYTIFVSHCLDNNLNKSEEFNVLTAERYYEIQNLTPFTEYKLKFTLSNFYFDQLSINPFDSNVIRIKTNLGKLNVPENISVLALTPTIAVVHWMPPKKLNCVVVTYEVHWKLVNDTQQQNKQFINVPKRVADGRYFTKINLSLPVQDYLIYVRVYPSNFSDFYNECFSKIDHIYSEPNNITLSGVTINSMNISWISNINLTVFFTLEFKDIAAEKWQTMEYIKMNYNNEMRYHFGKLKSGTLYKFRLILRYPEYEEAFTWPTDERFIFSTLNSSLNKPTSLRAFVQFDSQFTEKVNDIFVTLRWNQPNFTDEIIQGYTVHCFFIEDLKDIQFCEDKNITTTELEHTVHNLTFNTTYYFRVRAHTKIVAGPYTDFINVSTTHENPIPKLLFTTNQDIQIWDVDLNIITNLVMMSQILYHISYNRKNREYDMMKYHLDGKNEQIIQINASFCLFQDIDFFHDMIIDNMNNEEPLIYWLSENYTTVTDINVSMCNRILYKKNVDDNINFKSMTIDKTNIYILAIDSLQYILYVLKKKYASLKSVPNAYKYVKKIPISSDKNGFYKIYAFDKSSQSYPPMRCLTPDEKVYNFENVTATANSIIVNLPEPVVKSGCKKYNLPTTIYTIFVSHCLDNLNKSEEFNVQTFERYYEFQKLTPFTEYKLKFTLSNFYFDQLSINPFDSNVIRIKTNLYELNVPENISVLALTPTIAVVHWMPPKKLNCVVVTYEVHWKLVNDTQQENKQFINVPKRMADGRFFTKINLSLPVQDYLIYVRVYPSNFSDFYNESLSKINYIYSEPNNITLSGVNTNSMNISWLSNINLMISSALEYKNVSTEKWQTTNDIRMNYNKEVIYHIRNLQSGTLYKFRLILRYLEYEEIFIWPADERFIFSTYDSKRDDISNTPGILATKYYLPLMLTSIFIVTIVVIVTIIWLYRLYRQRKSNYELLLPSTTTDIELDDIELEILQEVPEFSTIYSPMLHYNPDECEITKIARKQITFTKLIGSGTFGKVYQGKVKNLESSGTEISVAIKTLRKDASSHEKKRLLKEAELMNRFRHKHILRLLGVCLDGISPFLVFELMETGDLSKYLRDCRNLEASDSHALRLQDLVAMCEDVARGCCYLEELRFVHKDLACRNCLVSSRNHENCIIKIGDFGLARDIYKDDYYRMRGEDLLPVRWMAPESLMIRTFTSQSDVWSFGVLMWEITSLGEQPYSAKTNEEVINYVRAGGKLLMTLNCPSALYQLMLRCWCAADARPNFEFCLNNIIALRENIEDALLSPVDTI